MNKRIQDISLVPSNYRRKRARAPREEGVFFGATTVARFAAIVAACTGAIGCSSPQPQTGTNTNWACSVDADCAEHEGTTCQDGLCVKSVAPISNPGDACASGACAGQPDVGAGSPRAQDDAVQTIGSLYSVVSTDTGFIATGYRPTATSGESIVATSGNGRDWVPIAAPGDGIGNVAIGNGTLVATTRVSGKPGFIVLPPGGTWQFSDPDQETQALLFGNGMFFALLQDGGNLLSTDGIHWSRSAGANTPLYGFADGRFFAWMLDSAPRQRIRTSVDGVTWSDPKPIPAHIEYWTHDSCVAAAGDEILGLGFADCMSGACPPLMLSLPLGGDTWAPATVQAPWAGTAEFMPAGITVSATRIAIVTSNNGSTSSRIWTTAVPRGSEVWQSADTPSDWQLFDIAYAAGVFVVVGQRLQGAYLLPVLATSTDGLNWQEIVL